MDLSIVIVNYQTFELTKNTINSVFQYSYPFTPAVFLAGLGVAYGKFVILVLSVDGSIKQLAVVGMSFASARNVDHTAHAKILGDRAVVHSFSAVSGKYIARVHNVASKR